MSHLSAGKIPLVTARPEWRVPLRRENEKADEKVLENGTSVDSCHCRQKSLGGVADYPSRRKHADL